VPGLREADLLLGSSREARAVHAPVSGDGSVPSDDLG
jgi:hypothetical protein